MNLFPRLASPCLGRGPQGPTPRMRPTHSSAGPMALPRLEKAGILRSLLALTAIGLLAVGCSGSGAVNPLSPAAASKPDASTAAEEDSDVIYWTAFPVTFTATDSLNGICLVDKKFGWACGNNGLLLKWDGTTWSKVETGLAQNENLMAVAFADENEGWAMGTQGIILHYLNGTWTLDNSPTQQLLYGAVVTPSRTVWAVGANGTILTYNGLSWGTVYAVSQSGGASTTVTQDIYGVGMYGQNNGWAVGNLGLIMSFDGQKWTPFSASPTTERLNSVSVINEVQAWIVGAFGTILRYNGTTWTKMTSAFSGFDFYSVSMKSDDDGWAAGQDGTIVYYDGSRWINHQKPEGKPSLNAIAFYKDLGFMVGQNGTILKFQPNGEMAQFNFLFKGTFKQPSKENPYWTVTYTLMNQSPKASPLVTFEVPIPKGLEPYQPKPTATPTPYGTVTAGSSVTAPSSGLTSSLGQAPSAGSTSSGQATPTPFPAANPQANTTAGPGSATPGAKSSTSSAVASAVTGAWKMKDNNLEWEIGNVSSSELKTLSFLLEDKKGEKKDYPVILQAVLKSTDKTIAEAAPVTLMASEPKRTGQTTPSSGSMSPSGQALPASTATAVPTPPAKPTAPSSGATSPTVQASSAGPASPPQAGPGQATTGNAGNPQQGGASNVQPTPTPQD